MEISLPGGLGAVALIMGLVELVKRLGMQSRWAGLFSVVVGVALMVSWRLWGGGVEWTVWEAVIMGITAGLAGKSVV